MRILAGMTLRSTADLTGIPKSTLWAVERGHARLGRDDESRVVSLYSEQIRIWRGRAEEVLLHGSALV
jgi:hypothetical protein